MTGQVIIILLLVIIVQAVVIAIILRQGINKTRAELSQRAVDTRTAVSEVKVRLDNVEVWLGSLIKQRETDARDKELSHAEAESAGRDQPT